MKRASLNLELIFDFKIGLAEQIVSQITEKILDGYLQPGLVLPSIRTLAAQLKVSVDTVVSAYKELEEQGFIKAKRGSRFVVLKNESVLIQTNEKKTPAVASIEKIKLSERARFAEELSGYFERNNYKNRPFVVYGSGLAKLLDKEWTKQAAMVARSPWNHTDYSDPAGFLPLRRAIAARLLQHRGIKCSAENVIITNGTVQNLNLVFKVLFEPGDTLAMESPSASMFSQIAFFNGLHVHHIPVSERGLTKEHVESLPTDVRGLFVSPANQTPLSVTMEENCRLAVLERAFVTKSWTLEADMENIVWYNGMPLKPLRAEEGSEHRVVYMDSFTLQFYPGIKIGYLVVPDGFEKAFAGAKLMSDRSSSEQSQTILARFLESSSYDSHLRKLRKKFRNSLSSLQKTIAQHLLGFGHLSNTKCGSHIAFHLDSIPDVEAALKLKEKGILVRPLSSFGGKCSKMNGFMMGFGSFSEEEIQKAVLEIKEVLKTFLHR